MKRFSFLRHFNWRVLLIRLLVYGLALTLTAIVIPDIYFVEKRIYALVIITVGLGLLNAIVRPILQFLTLPFVFATYGFVLVAINTIILYLLAWLFPNIFAVTSFWWALVGGAVIAILSSFLESLLGVTVPIVPDEQVELRRRLAEEDRNFVQSYLKARAARTQTEVSSLALPENASDTQSAEAADTAGQNIAPASEEGRLAEEVAPEGEVVDEGDDTVILTEVAEMTSSPTQEDER